METSWPLRQDDPRRLMILMSFDVDQNPPPNLPDLHQFHEFHEFLSFTESTNPPVAWTTGNVPYLKHPESSKGARVRWSPMESDGELSAKHLWVHLWKATWLVARWHEQQVTGSHHLVPPLRCRRHHIPHILHIPKHPNGTQTICLLWSGHVRHVKVFFSELSHTCSYRSCFISCRALNVFHICEATLFGVTGPATQLLDQSLAGTRYHKMSQASKTRPCIEVGLQWICETNWPQVCPTYQRGSDVVPLGHTGHAGHTGPYWAMVGWVWPAYVSTNTTFVVALCPSQGVLKAALKDGQGGTTGNSWGASRVLPFSISSHRYIDPYGRYGPVWPCMTHVHPCPCPKVPSQLRKLSTSVLRSMRTMQMKITWNQTHHDELHLTSDAISSVLPGLSCHDDHEPWQNYGRTMAAMGPNHISSCISHEMTEARTSMPFCLQVRECMF